MVFILLYCLVCVCWPEGEGFWFRGLWDCSDREKGRLGFSRKELGWIFFVRRDIYGVDNKYSDWEEGELMLLMMDGYWTGNIAQLLCGYPLKTCWFADHFAVAYLLVTCLQFGACHATSALIQRRRARRRIQGMQLQCGFRLKNVKGKKRLELGVL